MKIIIATSVRGFNVSLFNQNNGYLELVYNTPSEPMRSAGTFEEKDIECALERYHEMAGLLVTG